MNNRKFGVEIECYTKMDWDTLEDLLPGWDIKEDGSLENGFRCDHGWYDECDCRDSGVELASPVLQGIKGMEELEKGFRILNKADAWLEDDCGIHVHHEVRDLSNVQLYNVARSWFNNQDTISRFVARHRLDHQYCEPLTIGDLEEIEREMRGEHPQYGHEKYKTLSFATRDCYGTLEVRLHQGSLDYEDVKSWVLFGQAFIENTASRKRPLETCSPEDLLKYTRTYKAASENLLKRVK